MRKFSLIILFCFIFSAISALPSPVPAFGDLTTAAFAKKIKSTGRAKTVSVRSYHKKDGTIVRGHARSNPRR